MKSERLRYLPGVGVVSINEWWAAQARAPRSDLPRPAIRTDSMDDTLNHADGRTYDSRSAYDAALRAKGCHVVERGEQTGQPKTDWLDDDLGLERDIKDSIEKLEGMT